MNFVIRLYIWGMLADLLIKLVALIFYSFEWQERSTYQANLNKIDLSVDPVYLQVHYLPNFKHTTLRFWRVTFLDLFSSLLSWYSALYRIHRIIKLRQINSMLTPEQKQAAFVLRNNPVLSKEEVIEHLKILEPELVVREPGTIVISKEVDSKEFSRLFSWALIDKKGREVLLALLESSGMTITPREIAILKYVVGEKDSDWLSHRLQEIAEANYDPYQAEVMNRQISMVQSLFGKEAAEEVDDKEEEDEEDLPDTVNPK